MKMSFKMSSEPVTVNVKNSWWICPPWQYRSLLSGVTEHFSLQEGLVPSWSKASKSKSVHPWPGIWAYKWNTYEPFLGKPCYCLEITHPCRDDHLQWSCLSSSTRCLGKKTNPPFQRGTEAKYSSQCERDRNDLHRRYLSAGGICSWTPHPGWVLQCKEGAPNCLSTALQCCNFPRVPGELWLLSVAISHSSMMLTEWVKGTAFALYYSSEGSLLSRAENLPSCSSISQHASLCESFKNAQLSQCPHWGSMWVLHSHSMCLCLQGPMALEVHFICSVYISLSLNRVKAYCH